MMKIGFFLHSNCANSPLFKGLKSMLVNPADLTLGSGSQLFFIAPRAKSEPTPATAPKLYPIKLLLELILPP